MTAVGLFQWLQAQGVLVTPHPDETLRYKAPTGVLTPVLLDAMRQCTTELHVLVEAFEERAGMMEHDAGLERLMAHALAWECMRRGPEEDLWTRILISRGDTEHAIQYDPCTSPHAAGASRSVRQLRG